MKKAPAITAEEFDRRFDEGEDVSAFVDFSQGRNPHSSAKRVNVDFPAWMVRDLDQQAARLGVTRQSIIKVWIAERLKKEAQQP